MTTCQMKLERIKNRQCELKTKSRSRRYVMCHLNDGSKFLSNFSNKERFKKLNSKLSNQLIWDVQVVILGLICMYKYDEK